MLRLLALVAGALVALAANWLFWSLPNRPYDLEARPLGIIRSVSFAPFRDGQSPLVKRYPSAAEIEEDLTLLKGRVAGVRTYTSREGLEVVPEIARRLGLQVTMSAWIGSEADINDQEVEALIGLANAYPDVITRVIVGNEVLLRKEQKPEALAAYIRRVRAAVKQPVSYADVWEFWKRNPALAAEVDFVTIHILPYWENHPSSVEDLEPHVMAAYREIERAFPGKPLLIGEAGWPSAGRQRGPAVPSLVNKARFVNGFRALAADRGVDYNLIEAFDQGWKQKLEGTVGANWGLFSADRVAKWGADGKVVEDPHWRRHFLVTGAIALLLLGWIAITRPGLSAHGALWAAAGAQVIATAGVSAVLLEWLHAYSAWRLAWTGFAALLTLATAAALATAFRSLGAPEAAGAPWARRAARLYGVWAALAVAHGFAIAFDGRYRDFPNALFALPLVGTAVFLAARLALGRRPTLAIDGLYAAGSGPVLGGDGRAILFAGALATAIGVTIGETLANREALVWAAMTVLMALPFAAGMRLTARPPRPART
ncbi:glycosyl hydrolase family 17 protein [Stella sp.]|uniref:glycoside hydrolase family 17 protein n=1 Tax=Stella sp. TaxID=2912054 RepID=UPI0035AE307C